MSQPTLPPTVATAESAKSAAPRHPVLIRVCHWLNVPLLAVMVWSGLMILSANAVYRIGWGDWTLIRVLDFGVLEWAGLRYRLAEGISLHFSFMWLLVLNGLVHIGYLIYAGHWRRLAPEHGLLTDLRGAAQVAAHDLRLVAEPPPHTGYNPAQRFAYAGVLVMAVGLVLSGLAIYKPTQLSWLTSLFGGYEWARWVHFWLTMAIMGFFVVHIGQVVKAGWDNFQAMITGYHRVEPSSHGSPPTLPSTPNSAEPSAAAPGTNS